MILLFSIGAVTVPITGPLLFAVTMAHHCLLACLLPNAYCTVQCTGGQSSRKFVLRQSELLSKQSLTYQP